MMVNILFLFLLQPVDTLREAVKAEYLSPTVKEITQADIRAVSANNVADALRHLQGVQIKDYGGVGGLKTINVRSLGAQHTTIYLDGLPVHNSQNAQVDLGKYSVSDISSIDVSQGIDYNRTATELSSTSNVFLRSGKVDEFSTDVNVGISSFLSGDLTALVKIPHGKWSFKTLAEACASKGRYKFTYNIPGRYDTTDVRKNTEFMMAHLESAANYYDNGLSASVKLYYHDSYRGLPGPVVRISPIPNSDDHQWDRNGFIQAHLKKQYDRSFLQVKYKSSLDYTRYKSEDKATRFIDNEYWQYNHYLSALYALSLKKWKLSLSWDNLVSHLTTDYSHHSKVFRWKSDLSYYAGYRHGKFDIRHSGVFSLLKDNDFMFFYSPTLETSYRFYDFTISFLLKRSCRYPTLNDIYYVSDEIMVKHIGPEIANQSDLTIRYYKALDKWSFWAKQSVFYNVVDNKIVCVPSVDQFKWSVINYGRVCGYGSETSFRINLQAAVTWSLLGSYTYESAKDITDSRSMWYNNQIAYTPEHSFSLSTLLGYNGWTFTASYLYTGYRFKALANIRENFLKPWANLDLSMSKEIKRYKISLNVYNVLDDQYEIVARYPMPGINFLLKLYISI